MALSTFSSYSGIGAFAAEHLHYSQAARLGPTIKISGQGGWDPSASTVSLPSDAEAQTVQAFANVELALKTAGGKGWSQVYSIRSYHCPLDENTTAAMVKNLREWCGETLKPIWTQIGVQVLGMPEMKVEIEVEAWVGE